MIFVQLGQRPVVVRPGLGSRRDRRRPGGTAPAAGRSHAGNVQPPPPRCGGPVGCRRPRGCRRTPRPSRWPRVRRPAADHRHSDVVPGRPPRCSGRGPDPRHRGLLVSRSGRPCRAYGEHHLTECRCRRGSRSTRRPRAAGWKLLGWFLQRSRPEIGRDQLVARPGRDDGDSRAPGLISRRSERSCRAAYSAASCGPPNDHPEPRVRSKQSECARRVGGVTKIREELR